MPVGSIGDTPVVSYRFACTIARLFLSRVSLSHYPVSLPPPSPPIPPVLQTTGILHKVDGLLIDDGALRVVLATLTGVGEGRRLVRDRGTLVD